MPHDDAEYRKGSASNIHDPATRELSVVVPSYNEENRCKIFLVLRKRRKNLCVVTVMMQKLVGLTVDSGRPDYVSDFGHSYQKTVQVH